MAAHGSMFLDEMGLAALRERRHRKAAAATAEAAKRNPERAPMPAFPGAVGGTVVTKVETIPQEWALARQRAAALDEVTRAAGSVHLDCVRRRGGGTGGGTGGSISGGGGSVGDGSEFGGGENSGMTLSGFGESSSTSVSRVVHRPMHQPLPNIRHAPRVAAAAAITAAAAAAAAAGPTEIHNHPGQPPRGEQQQQQLPALLPFSRSGSGNAGHPGARGGDAGDAGDDAGSGGGGGGGGVAAARETLEPWRSAPVESQIEQGMTAARKRREKVEAERRRAARRPGSSMTPRQKAEAEAAAAEAAATAKREAAAAKRRALGPGGSAEVPEYEPSDLSFVVPANTSRSGFDNGFYESGWMYF